MRMRAALHQDRDGTHGRRWVSNINRRSVSSRVIKPAPIPVTLIKQTSARGTRAGTRIGTIQKRHPPLWCKLPRKCAWPRSPRAAMERSLRHAIAAFITGMIDRRAL